MYMYSCPGWNGTWKGLGRKSSCARFFATIGSRPFPFVSSPLVFVTLSSHSPLLLLGCGLQSPLEPKQSSIAVADTESREQSGIVVVDTESQNNQVFFC